MNAIQNFLQNHFATPTKATGTPDWAKATTTALCGQAKTLYQAWDTASPADRARIESQIQPMWVEIEKRIKTFGPKAADIYGNEELSLLFRASGGIGYRLGWGQTPVVA